MTIWFTSDTHFNHAKIIEYCNRPFASVSDMNFALTRAWQDAVKPDDEIYFLGDFCIGRESYALDILQMLPGTKHLIAGNHDGKKIRDAGLWYSVQDYMELKHEGQLLVMAHYPFAVWNRSHYGSFNLHGHSHGTFKTNNARQIDVGVDCWGYAPASLEQILARGGGIHTYVPKDHHGQAAT